MLHHFATCVYVFHVFVLSIYSPLVDDCSVYREDSKHDLRPEEPRYDHREAADYLLLFTRAAGIIITLHKSAQCCVRSNYTHRWQLLFVTIVLYSQRGGTGSATIS